MKIKNDNSNVIKVSGIKVPFNKEKLIQLLLQSLIGLKKYLRNVVQYINILKLQIFN